MEKQKTCKNCQETKGLTEFSYKKTSKGRAALRLMCRACELLVHGKHR